MKKTIPLLMLLPLISACSLSGTSGGEMAVTRIESVEEEGSGGEQVMPSDMTEEDVSADDRASDETVAAGETDDKEQEDFLAAFDEANAHFDSYTVSITDSRAPGQSVIVSSQIVNGVVMTYRQHLNEGEPAGEVRPDTLDMKDGMFSMTLRGDPVKGGWEVSAYIVEGDGSAILSLAGVFDYFHESWHTDAGMYIDRELSTSDTVVVVCNQPVQETVTELVTDGTGAVSERIYYVDADTMLVERVKEVRSGSGDGGDEITEYAYSGYNDTVVELPQSLTDEMGDVREIYEGYREQLSNIEAGEEDITGPGETT
ncbi:MAG: hypothetical protein K6C95_09200 [Lachnospiraceae bacterium]|nr:hypothetical protein [Lachnospiraceae bacterium]